MRSTVVAKTVEQTLDRVPSDRVAQDLYRLILCERGSELLVVGQRPPFTLPCVEIPRWDRVAENLNEAVKTHYGLSALCLFATEAPNATTDSEPPKYQVMEIREAGRAVPNEMRWLRFDAISDQSFADDQDLLAIKDALHKIAGFQSGEIIGAFGRPGWIEELFRWIQGEIQPYGLHLTRNIRQINASPTFSLIRLETNAQAVWFKAVGEPNLREFGISVALAKLFPGFVPTVLATHPAWHGWLTTEFSGSTLDEAPDAAAWERAAHTLAEIQIASAGNTDQLIHAGCRDLRIPRLLNLVDPFMAVVSQLMERQQKTPPAILGKNELLTLGSRIKETLLELSELDIPDTLGHLDFNSGNILCSADQCVFLDWAEAYVGPPFLTLQYLFEHLARMGRGELGFGTNVVQAHEIMWLEIITPERATTALVLAPVVAVFAYAAGTEAWQNATMLREPKTAAYLRSLTRRMNDEMQRLQARRSPCRS